MKSESIYVRFGSFALFFVTALCFMTYLGFCDWLDARKDRTGTDGEGVL